MIVADAAAVIGYCQAQDVPLVNISTSEVYGFSGEYRESDACVVPAANRWSPRLEYAVGKLAAEMEIRLSGIEAVSIRPFNVVGARQLPDGGFVLPTFAEQAVSGQALTIFGPGLQVRCLTAVEDVAAFVHHAINRGALEGVVNVGNPANRTDIVTLAHKVCDAAGVKHYFEWTNGRAVHGPDYAEAEGVIKTPNIDRARALGWAPKRGLDELIADAVAHARVAA
jgi:UDP-glucose 4-epimerase